MNGTPLRESTISALWGCHIAAITDAHWDLGRGRLSRRKRGKQ
jgi:hypothetical protein